MTTKINYIGSRRNGEEQGSKDGSKRNFRAAPIPDTRYAVTKKIASYTCG